MPKVCVWGVMLCWRNSENIGGGGGVGGGWLQLKGGGGGRPAQPPRRGFTSITSTGIFTVLCGVNLARKRRGVAQGREECGAVQKRSERGGHGVRNKKKGGGGGVQKKGDKPPPKSTERRQTSLRFPGSEIPYDAPFPICIYTYFFLLPSTAFILH